MPRMARVLLVAILAASGVACSEDPERAKVEYLKSGDRYFGQKKYAEAIVHYRNALQHDPKFGQARYKLAQSLELRGDLRAAAREFVRAADAMPGSPEVQVKAASYLLAGGQFEDARARAQIALKLDPKNLDAQIVVGNSLAGLKDLDAALKQLEDATRLDPSSASAFASLGAVQLARGSSNDAELAFRRAVETNPNLPNAHMALAGFLWASGRPDEAEQSFKKALTVDTKNLLARRALSTFYISRGRAVEAEPHMKALADADVSPAAPMRLALADYYVMLNRPDDAMKILDEVARNKDGFAAARARVAALQYDKKEFAQADKEIREVLARDPRNVPALIVHSKFLAAKKNFDEAISQAKAATSAAPDSIQAHYLLGAMYRATNRVDEAISAFNEVLKLNPRATAAQLQLSELNLAKGARQPALQLAQDAARAVPNDPAIQLNLVRALLANGDVARAGAVAAPLVTKYPKVAVVHAAQGSVAMASKDVGQARRAFSRTLELDAGNFEALSGLVQLDFVEHKTDAARARVDQRLAAAPDDSKVLSLAARVYASSGDMAKAERYLQTSIEKDPSNLQAYVSLAQLYASQKKLAEARGGLEKVIAKQPDAVGPQIMFAVLSQMEGNRAEARKHYERVLQIDPKAGVAANNLAYLYAEDGGNLDVALQLAQTAKEQIPNSPEVDDTLGWVYYQKNLAGLAMPLFEQASRADPKNSVYQYRLGLASAKAGEPAKARRALEQAIKLNSDPATVADARKALDQL